MLVFVNDYHTHFDVTAHVDNDAYVVNQWCNQTGIYGQWHYFTGTHYVETKHGTVAIPIIQPVVFFNGVDRNTAVMIQLGLK